MQPSKQELAAYKLGRKLQGKNWEEIVDQDLAPWQYAAHSTLNLFFESGLYGLGLPQWVTGWRYGRIPDADDFGCSYSYNYRDDKPEVGVSAMQVIQRDGTVLDTQDKISAMFITGKRYDIEGWLHFRRGSDGEPLLVGCKYAT
jgi:hypothetical protein